MQPTRKTQPHRRGKPMVQGPSLAAMLRGAGSMGNPQDVKRETAKRWAQQKGTLRVDKVSAGGRGVLPADGGDSGPSMPRISPDVGASATVPPPASGGGLTPLPRISPGVPRDGVLSQMLAMVPMTRNAPGGGGQGVGGEENNLWPDGNPRKRPPRARRAPYRGQHSRQRGPYRGLPPFDTYPQRTV